MSEPTGVAAEAAALLFRLPGYRLASTTVTAGGRQVVPWLCDIPVAGPAEVVLVSTVGTARSGGARNNVNGSWTLSAPVLVRALFPGPINEGMGPVRVLDPIVRDLDAGQATNLSHQFNGRAVDKAGPTT